VLLFGRLQTMSKVTAITAGIVVGVVLLFSGPRAVAWLAALAAGVATGWLVDALLGLRTTERRFWRVHEEPPATRSHLSEEPDIDDILDKISRCGLHSLSPAERERLEAARRAKLRRSAARSFD
jgi:hypothetical protein